MKLNHFFQINQIWFDSPLIYLISFQAFQTEEIVKSSERPSDKEIEATGTSLEDLKIRKTIKDKFEDNENACKK